MLKNLQLSDFVLVERAELEFESGFTVLTGETGAGKSVLVDAIALVLGGRGDANVVRQGCDKASISATFDCTPNLTEWLLEHEIDAEDALLLRRVIDAQGKSRAFINGVAVPLAQLRELGDQLVDIHGQHAHQLLLKPAAQRDLLDAFGGLAEPLAKVHSRFQTLKAAQTALELAQHGSEKLQLERERLAWQLDELERVAPQPGEWQEIEAEHRVLANAAQLMATAGQTADALSERENALVSELDSLHSRLADAMVLDPRLADVVQALDEARIQTREAAHALAGYLQSTELDPARLTQLEGRIGILHDTARKLRHPAPDLPALWQSVQTRISTLDRETDLQALQQALHTAQTAFDTDAKTLSRGRATAAKRLAKGVTEAMQTMAMSGGLFSVQVQSAAPSASGMDTIEFLVAGHAGAEPRPIGKVASGGELSRIALAISVMASTATATPTLIFDEVDSGVGGAIAEVVGRRMRELGRDRQVLAVTHLPQVAAQAHHQLEVQKRPASIGVATQIRPLTEPERVAEIARMLGGQTVTATTLDHAREMLAMAGR
jgi:DNA repair protein RecN (Recombination protein N)